MKESKKPKGAPDWHDSDAPDAEGRFKDLGIKDLAAWLIKTRKKDLKKISGALTQQIVFNRKKDPEYADKMEKTRKEVYKQLGRKDLLESINDGIVSCNGCGWKWDIVEGGDDPYTCHKCGHDNNQNEVSESRVKRFSEFINEGYFSGISKSTASKKKAQMKKQSDMDDDDPDAYKEMPGDTKGKKHQKTSKHTKKYHELYEDDDQKSTDRSPIDSSDIEKALKKKSDETGVPIGIIRAVMRRGMAAWKTGHRPGAGQEQWGYARVNAFLTKGEGTWGKADKDLAKEVRDGGHDKKLKG